MASIQLSLLGQYPIELHSTVIERLAAQSENAVAYTSTEMVFQRDGTVALQDDHSLRVRAIRTSDQPDRTRWSIQVLQKPEPARLSPEVLQRPVIECVVEEGAHPRALASSLGFSTLAFTLHSRGTLFHRSSSTIQIEVYQLYPTTSSTTPLGPSHYVVHVSTRYASAPRSGNVQDQKTLAMAGVKGVQALLKGLVDLSRVE